MKLKIAYKYKKDEALHCDQRLILTDVLMSILAGYIMKKPAIYEEWMDNRISEVIDLLEVRVYTEEDSVIFLAEFPIEEDCIINKISEREAWKELSDFFDKKQCTAHYYLRSMIAEEAFVRFFAIVSEVCCTGREKTYKVNVPVD